MNVPRNIKKYKTVKTYVNTMYCRILHKYSAGCLQILIHNIVYVMHDIGCEDSKLQIVNLESEILLQNRMSATLAVVGSFVISFSMVVIKDEMLALKADNFGNTLKIFAVFSDYKGTRIICQHHSGGI